MRAPRVPRDAWPVVFVLPALVIELVLHVVPVLMAVVASLRRLTPRELHDWLHAPWVGTDNYRAWLRPDSGLADELADTVVRTGAYVILVVAASWAIGMAAAVAVRTATRRTLWELLFLLPFAVPGFVTVLAWRFVLDHDAGMVAHTLVDLGLTHEPPFLLLGESSFWSVVVVSTWRLWPLVFLVLLAAMRAIPPDLYDAASVDGASAWRRFRFVTAPGTARASLLVVLLLALWTATDFSTPYLLFDATPPPQATLLGNLIYERAFAGYDLGSAAAASVLVTAVLVVLGSPLVRPLVRSVGRA